MNETLFRQTPSAIKSQVIIKFAFWKLEKFRRFDYHCITFAENLEESLFWNADYFHLLLIKLLLFLQKNLAPSLFWSVAFLETPAQSLDRTLQWLASFLSVEHYQILDGLGGTLFQALSPTRLILRTDRTPLSTLGNIRRFTLEESMAWKWIFGTSNPTIWACIRVTLAITLVLTTWVRF